MEVDNQPTSECTSCGETCTCQRSLQENESVESDDDDDPLQCEFCEVHFKNTLQKLKHYKKIHYTSRSYKCTVCKKKFTHTSNLKSHMRLHTGEKPFKCKICGRTFAHKGSLKGHETTHTNEKPFKCELCEKTFKMKVLLRLHFERKHTNIKSEESYQCPTCDKIFTKKCSLVTHEIIHLNERLHKCDICHRAFNQKIALKLHRSIHSDERPFKCQFCGKGFKRKDSLKDHEKIHTGQTHHQCKICNKGFIKSSALKVHERSHTGDKPYKCKTCGMSFALNHTLKIHEGSHGNTRPFKCEICEKSFKYKSNLKDHELVHTGVKNYKCRICERAFTMSTNLRKHEQIHINDKPGRYLSGKKGNKNSSTMNASENTKVSVASSDQTKLEENQIEIKTENSLSDKRPHKCEVCEKRFKWKSNLREHEMIHTGVFKCPKCEKTFSTSNILRKHKIIHSNDKPYAETGENATKNLLTMNALENTNASVPSPNQKIKSEENQLEIKNENSLSDKRPFKCEVCEKRFKWKSNLREHEILHTGVKFKCQICEKSFSSLSYLGKHKLIHSNDKPYAETGENAIKNLLTMNASENPSDQKIKLESGVDDNQLEIETSENSSIFTKQKKKKKANSTGEKLYKCQICDKSFSTSGTCRRHQQVHLNNKPHKYAEKIRQLQISADYASEYFQENTKHITTAVSVPPSNQEFKLEAGIEENQFQVKNEVEIPENSKIFIKQEEEINGAGFEVINLKPNEEFSNQDDVETEIKEELINKEIIYVKQEIKVEVEIREEFDPFVEQEID